MANTNIKVVDYEATTNVATTPTVDLTISKFLGVQNSNDTNSLTFYASADGVNYGILFRVGTANTIATTTAYGFYLYTSIQWPGLKYLRMTKGTAAATLKLITEEV